MTAEATPQRRGFFERLPWVRQGAEDLEARSLASQVEQRVRTMAGLQGYCMVIEQEEVGARYETEVFLINVLINGNRHYKASIIERREHNAEETTMEILDIGEEPRTLRFDKRRNLGSKRLVRSGHFEDHFRSKQRHRPIRHGIGLMREIAQAQVDTYATQKAHDKIEEDLVKPSTTSLFGWSRDVGVPADDFAFIPIVSPGIQA